MALELEPCQMPEMSQVVVLELVMMQVDELGLEHFEPVPDAHATTGLCVPVCRTMPSPTAVLGLYVKRSLILGDDVPNGVVTMTSTAPVPGGDVAVIEVSELTVTAVAAAEPNLTEVAPVNPLPLTLTTVPPKAGPEFGETLETMVAYVNLSAALVVDVPAIVVTVMSTVPTDPAGDVAVICDAPLTLYDVAALVPNMTLLAPIKPVPVIVTGVPPEVLPVDGDIAVTVGAYVNWSSGLVGEDPAVVVTITSTTPVPAGDVAVIDDALFRVYDVAATVPNFTEVTPVKPLPEMTTEVPPAAGPVLGLTLVTDVAMAGTVPDGG